MLYYLTLACFFVVVSPRSVIPTVDIDEIDEIGEVYVRKVIPFGTDDASSNSASDANATSVAPSINGVNFRRKRSVGADGVVTISPSVNATTSASSKHRRSVVVDEVVTIRPLNATTDSNGNRRERSVDFDEVVTIRPLNATTDSHGNRRKRSVDVDVAVTTGPLVNATASASTKRKRSVGVDEGVSISPFANATSVFCGSKVDTFQAIIGARLRLHCGLAGSATTVDSPTCVRGVTEALHDCSGLSRLDMEQCLANAVVRLDGDACGLPTHTPYGPIRNTLCNTLFHIEDSMKSSVRTFCIDDHAAGTSREGRGGCGFWTWTGCAAAIASASIVCCAATACVAEAACMAGVLGAASGCLACI